jgi:hypothetical protein
MCAVEFEADSFLHLEIFTAILLVSEREGAENYCDRRYKEFIVDLRKWLL